MGLQQPVEVSRIILSSICPCGLTLLKAGVSCCTALLPLPAGDTLSVRPQVAQASPKTGFLLQNEYRGHPQRCQSILAALDLDFGSFRCEFKLKFTCPYIKSSYSLFLSSLQGQGAVRVGDATQVLQWCLLLSSYSQGKSPPCAYCAILVHYHSLVFVSESFSWTHLSLVFTVPGIACGSSSSKKKDNGSVQFWVSRAGSSMAELLLGEIFLGSQNQLCFLHT